MKKIILLIAAATIALMSCGKKEGEGSSSAQADSMKTAYTALMKAFESGNPEGIEQYISSNPKDHTGMPGYEGLEGMKKMIVEWKAGFPDGTYKIEDMRVDGDVLVARIRYSGTNTGPSMWPTTNKKVTDLMFIDWSRWENGKFVEHWGAGEDMKMMQQLGLMPPMGGAPPADTTKKAM